MSQIIPPMVSSSPPPMDDNLEDDDDDDEFGNFSTANFSYDDLDIIQPSQLSTNGVKDNVTTNSEGTKNTIHVDNIKQECVSRSSSDFSRQNGTNSPVDSSQDTKEKDGGEVRTEGTREMQQNSTIQDSSFPTVSDPELFIAGQNCGGAPELHSNEGLYDTSQVSSSQDTGTNYIDTCTDRETIQFSVSCLPGEIDVPVDNKIQMPQGHTDNSILNDVKPFNCLEQINGDVIKGEKSVTLTSGEAIIVDNFSKFSESQSNVNNTLSNNYVTSILNDSCINDVNIENMVDQSVVNSSNLNSEELQTTNTSNDIPCPVKSRRLESQEVDSRNLLKKDSLMSCSQLGEYDKSDPTSNLEDTSSSLFPDQPTTFEPSCEPHESASFASFECTEGLSLPPINSYSVKTNTVVDSDDEFADFASSTTLPQASTSGYRKNESLECEEFSDFSSVTNQIYLSGSESLTITSKVFDADDDFDDFASCEDKPSTTQSIIPVSNSKESPESDDEFADFASSAPSSYPSVIASDMSRRGDLSKQICPAPVIDDDFDDDFDDFETASFTPVVMPSAVEGCQLSSRLESVVTTLFPSDSLTGTSTEFLSRGPMIDRNSVWTDLRDVDTSHALTYQWVNSSSNKMLLSSLGIDTRNILFGPKWNQAVPRFAANLGVSPLEPVRARSPPLTLPTGNPSPKPSQLDAEATSSGRTEEMVPDAQFDWNSSGLVNPLDCAHSTLLDLDILNSFNNLTLPSSDAHAAIWRLASVEKEGDRTATIGQLTGDNGRKLLTPNSRAGLSSEAVKVLDSLPNLSYLRSKTLVFSPPGQTVMQR